MIGFCENSRLIFLVRSNRGLNIGKKYIFCNGSFNPLLDTICKTKFEKSAMLFKPIA